MAREWDATEPPLASIPMGGWMDPPRSRGYKKGVEASCGHEYLHRAMGAPDRGVLISNVMTGSWLSASGEVQID